MLEVGKIKCNRKDILSLLDERIREYFGKGSDILVHIEKVVDLGRKIAKKLKADEKIVMEACYLHDVGVKASRKKHGFSKPEYQEEMGVPIAEDILRELGEEDKIIHEVGAIIGRHHHPDPSETKNFKAVFDADQIVNFEESLERSGESDEPSKRIEQILLTEEGKSTAAEIFSTRD